MFTVYRHYCKQTGKSYIGITSMSLEQRWLNGKGYEGNKKFCKDIKRFGWKDGFEHIVIADNLSEKEAVEMEADLIEKYDCIANGYNNIPGGRYGKQGLLSHECKVILNGLKRSELSNNHVVKGWIKLFEFADNGTENNLHDFFNTCIPEIIKRLNNKFPGNYKHWIYDDMWIANFLCDLTYICKLDTYLNFGGEKPEYKTAFQYMREAIE